MTSLPRIHSVDNHMLLMMESPFPFEFHQSAFKYTVTSCETGVLLLFQSVRNCFCFLAKHIKLEYKSLLFGKLDHIFLLKKVETSAF